MRFAACLSVPLLTVLPALAQAQQPPAPTYRQAEHVFQTVFDPNERVRFQILLTAAGYLNGVPNEEFTQRIFGAIERFQRENGFQPNGTLTREQVERVSTLA